MPRDRQPNRSSGRGGYDGRPPASPLPRRRIEPRSPGRDRIAGRGVRRSSGLPLPARLLLLAAIVLLGAGAVGVAGGGLSGVLAGLGETVGSTLDLTEATASPTPAPSGPLGIPMLTAPPEAYTNDPTVDVAGQLPAAAVGQAGYRIRLYLAGTDGTATLVGEVGVPTTAFFTIPAVPLVKGANEFSARVVDAAGNEGEPSVSIRYVLDTSVPKIQLSSPEPDALVAGETIELLGKTQGRSAIAARNAANGATASATAAGDGTFRITLPIEPGRNAITLVPTDPAGNVGSFEIAVVRGGEGIAATLRASAYRFVAAELPKSLTLTASATDPTGAPLVGATVTFSVSIPGLPVITGELLTDDAGVAVFQTTVPLGAMPGSGPASVFISSPYGTASAQTVITIE